MMLFSKPEEPMKKKDKIKMFFALHWRGVVTLLTPLILLAIVLPGPAQNYEWCAYTLLVMAIFWMTECIPLALTSFLPLVIFPLTSVMTSADVAKQYVNDTIIMFLGSLILAYSIEQSGLHKRLAFNAIKLIGYSHVKLLVAICIVTTFVSMWITNTAATTMMVPINFAVLGVFEKQKLLTIYNTNSVGEKVASDVTTCYFCAATYSATIGGIGTLVGTGTNLAFKGLFITNYPNAPELLSFPLFSAFGVPLMILLEIAMFFYLAIVYLGLFRRNSKVAKAIALSPAGMTAAKKAIIEDYKKLGKFTCWEFMVLILFAGAMIAFFSRSPQMFPGWADKLIAYHKLDDPKFILDSALAMLVVCLMLILPSSCKIFKNCTAEFPEELPRRVETVLIWKRLNSEMPWSFMFLLGGGFALSEAAKRTELNVKIGEKLQLLKDLPSIVVLLILIIIVIIITNIASNVAVANIMVPLAMQVAKETHINPLWYCIAAGFSASFAFMIPVGTPGNLIVQSAASIPTPKMIRAGIGPTITTIIITWLAMSFWAPVVWPSLKSMPDWVT